jgi:hypothetical protein
MKRSLLTISLAVLSVCLLSAQESTSGGSAPFSQSRFVPDISLIADFAALGRNVDDSTWAGLGVPGLATGNDAEHDLRGFNLRYAELAISAVADPYFDLTAIFHLHVDEFEIEEAYARTRRLPFGLQLKVGKFLSAFGRINSQHAHYWSFDGAPLVNRLFFGGEGLNELGGQLTWLAPLPFFLQLGAEILRGENDASFGTAELESLPEVRTPGLWTAFVKTSWDIGRLTALTGVSLAHGQTRSNADPANPNGFTFAGRSLIWGADLTFHYTIDSYRYLQLQTEWLARRADGETYDEIAVADMSKRQNGFYADLTWRCDRRWRLGVRLDVLSKNSISASGAALTMPNSLWGARCAIDFAPSEFSRLRLQYRYDHSGFLGSGRQPVHEIGLGLNLAIGAHGAHSF